MKPEQLEVAERNSDEFTERLGYAQSNLHFAQGYSECLDKAGIAAESKDMVISVCVASFTPIKEQVLREAYRVLRVGGELHIAGVFTNRRLPEECKKHDVLVGECIGGGWYIEDFKAKCREIGLGEPRALTIKPIAINHAEIRAVVDFVDFYCMTFRCFKVPNMEPREYEEDYGHVATYLGTIPEYPFAYELDASLSFETRRPKRVGGNTAAILKHSWLAKYFKVDGDWSEHFGRFDHDAFAGRKTTATCAPQASSCSSGGCC